MTITKVRNHRWLESDYQKIFMIFNFPSNFFFFSPRFFKLYTANSYLW